MLTFDERCVVRMGTITAKRLASCETNRTMSMVSNGTRTSSHEDANASAPLE